MPELPEVETIRRGLEKYLVGHTIESVEVRLAKVIQGDINNIEGTRVIDVRRFGKGLVIDLSNGYSLAIHIKLTGQLVYRNNELGIKNEAGRIEVPNKFTHVIFHLDSKRNPLPVKQGEGDQRSYLFYNDLRQFGWIKVVKTDEVQKLPFFKELGPEPPVAKAMEGKVSLSLPMFENLLKTSTPIKPLIMDQKKMAGVGNIYANDALYMAKIDPRRPAKSLSPQEVGDLYNAILSVLNKGLKYGGCSELTYVNALGEEGQYQHHTLIYGKDGERCKRDGSIIKKIMLAGRGTYFCPSCQN